MRTLERFALYALAAYVAVHALDRAGAQDAGTEATPAPKTLSANALEIRAENGVTVLRLSTTSWGGGQIEIFNQAGKVATRLFVRKDQDGELRLYDEHGSLRSTIGGNDAGGYANFYNRKTKIAAYIGADSAKDSGYFSLMGANEKKIVEAFANAKGGMVAVGNTATGKIVANLGTAPDTGTGITGLAGPDGRPGFMAFCTKDGGQATVLNAQGNKGAFLGISSNPAGNGLMYVARTDGKRLIEMGANAGRGGYFSVFNSQSKRVIFAGASTGDSPDDGVVEVERAGGQLGVVLRAYRGGSSVRMVKVNVR